MMKRVFLFSLITLLAVSAFAQDTGHADPTNRGRYTWYGSEVEHPGAQVLAQLPAGATCVPIAGTEMVGAHVWNSTRTNFVVDSVLTDKAKIAHADGKMFLCECARGYNQLFLPTPPASTAVPTPPPQPQSNNDALLRQFMEQQGERDKQFLALLNKRDEQFLALLNKLAEDEDDDEEYVNNNRGSAWGPRVKGFTIGAAAGTAIGLGYNYYKNYYRPRHVSCCH